MKKVLLTTTALVMTAGVSAADVSLSGSAGLAYGNWGTSGGSAQGWGQTTDVSITMSGEASGLAYSASLSFDESPADASPFGEIGQGALSVSGNGLSLSYQEGGELEMGATDDGDLKIGYAAGGVSVDYTEDTATDATLVALGYTAGDLTLGYSANSRDDKTVLSAGFTAGDIAINVSGQDSGATWDASAAYTLGASTITVATDETDNGTSLAIATSLNDVTISAKAKDNANTLSLGYTMGDITLSYAYDQGKGVTASDDGDDAQTIMTITYDLGGITLTGKANNLDEVQLGAAFTF